MRDSEPGCSVAVERGGRIGAEAEEQPAADRDAVQEDVGHLADAVGDEPLQPLIGGPDEQSREHGQHDDRRVLQRAPGAIEQERDQPVLDEVKALHDVDFRNAGRLGERIPDGADDRRGDGAVAEGAALSDAQQRRARSRRWPARR